MCIANHPVLYDLHMKALEQSCADSRLSTAKPIRASGAIPQSVDGAVFPGLRQPILTRMSFLMHRMLGTASAPQNA